MTVVFDPAFGAEPTIKGTVNGLNDATVYLQFEDGQPNPSDKTVESWNSPQPRPLEDAIIAAAGKLFSPSSPYLSHIMQYGGNGQAHVSTTVVHDDYPLVSGFGKIDPVHVFTHEYGNNLDDIIVHSMSQGRLPKPGDVPGTPIFVVLTPPGVSSDNVHESGYNFAGYYFNDVFKGHNGLFWSEWVGDRGDSMTTDLRQLTNNYKRLLSHEVTEQMAEPTGAGLALPEIDVPFVPPLHINLFASTYINHGANYPDEKNEHQISDLEAQRYNYLLNGVDVESYWSYNEHAFVVPDGNRQDFEVHTDFSTVMYDPNRTQVTGRTLIINGDQGQSSFLGVHLGDPDDSIKIDRTAEGRISVTLDGETVQFDDGDAKKDPFAITSIVVNPGLGTNSVLVKSLPADVHLTINAGASDTVTLASSDAFNGIMGNVRVNGSGNTILNIDDRGNGLTVVGSGVYLPLVTNYVVDGGQLTRAALLTKIGGFPTDPPVLQASTTISYGRLAGLTITGGTFAVNNYHVGDGKDDLDYLPSQLSFQGGGSGDTLSVDDRGNQSATFGTGLYDPSLTQYTVSGGQLTRTTVLNKRSGQSTDPPTRGTSTTISYPGLGGVTITGGKLGTYT